MGKDKIERETVREKGDLNGNFWAKMFTAGIFSKSNPKHNFVCKHLTTFTLRKI